jgi:hypothetical protein
MVMAWPDRGRGQLDALTSLSGPTQEGHNDLHERSRVEPRVELERVLGPEEATTLMEDVRQI